MRATASRIKVHACIHPETYKYVIAPSAVDDVWRELQTAYGPIRKNEGFRVMEIQSKPFILRATFRGNPITVIRTRRCGEDDVRRLHALLGYAA